MGLFADGFKELKKASEPLYKTPKSIQETIEIMAVAENGIFEVARNRYSKCYRFQDINYTTATEDEQIGIFERYCKFLNSLDCNFKITVNNKNKNMIDLREKVLLAYCDDGYDHFRKIYNDIIEEKIREGRQGIEQERYLTITIERRTLKRQRHSLQPWRRQFIRHLLSLVQRLYRFRVMKESRCFMTITILEMKTASTLV